MSTPAAVGPGPARDMGAKEATGDYVWFVDGDDELAEVLSPRWPGRWLGCSPTC